MKIMKRANNKKSSKKKGTSRSERSVGRNRVFIFWRRIFPLMILCVFFILGGIKLKSFVYGLDMFKIKEIEILEE